MTSEYLKSHWRIHTRPANENGDLAFAFALFKKTMMPFVDELEGWSDEAQFAHFKEGFSHPDMRMITYNGQTVGCFLLAENKDNIMLRRFYIEPSMQGKGIGRRIINMGLQQAHYHNKPLDLDVLPNNKPAIKAYEKTGFQPVPIGTDPHVNFKPNRIHMRHRETLGYQRGLYLPVVRAEKLTI